MKLKVLGQFGKSVEGGRSLNYGVSGGANCSPACRFYGNGCYAQRCEARPDRSELSAKLKRHESLGAAAVTDEAIRELHKLEERGESIPWLRLSTNGSLPIRPDDEAKQALRRLARHVRRRGIMAHIPVETPAKARQYREILSGLVVRESCQTLRRFLVADGAVSTVVGDDLPTRDRVSEAKRVARMRTDATGRKCIVCPAVAARFLGREAPRAKCGNCVACAIPEVDVVYPRH